MRGQITSIPFLATVLLLCAPLPAAQAAPPDATLKAKGLVRSGSLYLLDGDLNLRAGLRTMRQTRSRLDGALAKRAEIEHQIRGGHDIQAQLYAQNQDLIARMEKVKDLPLRYNELVNQVNVVRGKIQDIEQYIGARERAMKAFTIPSDEYAAAVTTLADQMEATQKQYDALAVDPEVKAALARMNMELRIPLKLGPSEQFTTELQSVRREREKLRSAGIKFDLEGGVPVVPVTLNGTLPWKMVIDSGAASVVLTYAVARELGISPEDADPTVSLRVADGQIVQARMKVLKSIKLGQFVLPNVECAVLPEGVAGDNLLGGTFLSRFVYRMDLNAGEIHLSEIGPSTKPADPGKTVATRAVPGTTRDVDIPKVSGQWIDLLNTVSLARDTVSGTWSAANGRVQTEVIARPAKLHIPCVWNNAYELHVEYESLDPPAMGHSLGICMPVGRNPVCLIVRPQDLGLEMVDGHRFDHNPTTKLGDFGIGTQHALDIVVWADATYTRIQVTLDGVDQIDWAGPIGALQANSNWEIPAGFGVGTWESRYAITAFKLRDGDGSALPRETPTTRPTITATTQPEVTHATVPAMDKWTATSFHVEQGRCYRLMATGRWKDSQGLGSGPDGSCPADCFALLGPPASLTAQQKAEYYVGQHPRGALVCRIGEDLWDFYVGSERRFIAPFSGSLSFRMSGGTDGKAPAPEAPGQCIVTIAPFEPEWVRPDGTIEITARLDLKDLLHLTPQGPWWEWDGVGGRLGRCGGYYPTIINDVFWWPRWVTRRTTEPLPVPALWPADPSRVRIIENKSPRGEVELAATSANDVSIAYKKGKGSGCSQIGVVLQVK